MLDKLNYHIKILSSWIELHKYRIYLRLKAHRLENELTLDWVDAAHGLVGFNGIEAVGWWLVLTGPIIWFKEGDWWIVETCDICWLDTVETWTHGIVPDQLIVDKLPSGAR